MTAPRIARAEALVADIRAALDAADLGKVVADIDAACVPSGARHGAVIVAAPKLGFDGAYGMTQAEYQLYVIAGPANDYLAAWDRIDTIIEALLAGHLNLKDGEPASWQGLHGDPLPAYTLTLNDLD